MAGAADVAGAAEADGDAVGVVLGAQPVRSDAAITIIRTNRVTIFNFLFNCFSSLKFVFQDEISLKYVCSGLYSPAFTYS